MKTIQSIQKKINTIKSSNDANVVVLENAAFSLLNKKFSAKKYKAIVSKMVDDVESSKNLIQGYGEYYSQYTRVDLSVLIDTKNEFQCNLLQRYFSENYNIEVDIENDCLMYSIGHAIIINHDGDVLDQDSGKWVISKDEYENDQELSDLIESYMEKSGYYPSIIRVDYHGNAFYSK